MGKYGKNTLAGEEAGKSEFFETFDSGSGPVVPEGMEDDFAHQDSKGLVGYTSNEVYGLDTEVPEVPAKKR